MSSELIYKKKYLKYKKKYNLLSNEQNGGGLSDYLHPINKVWNATKSLYDMNVSDYNLEKFMDIISKINDYLREIIIIIVNFKEEEIKDLKNYELIEYFQYSTRMNTKSDHLIDYLSQLIRAINDTINFLLNKTNTETILPKIIKECNELNNLFNLDIFNKNYVANLQIINDDIGANGDIDHILFINNHFNLYRNKNFINKNTKIFYLILKNFLVRYDCKDLLEYSTIISKYNTFSSFFKILIIKKRLDLDLIARICKKYINNSIDYNINKISNILKDIGNSINQEQSESHNIWTINDSSKNIFYIFNTWETSIKDLISQNECPKIDFTFASI